MCSCSREYEHAKKRGAKIYCELGGFGLGADAFHMTAPNVDGPKRSMLAALRNAAHQCRSEVQYLNAHGTSTPLGDLPTKPMPSSWPIGDHAKRLVVNSTKSDDRVTCWVELAASSRCSPCWPLHHQVSPPTINIFNQDPECDLDYCANDCARR